MINTNWDLSHLYASNEEFLKDFDMEIYEYYLKLIREERIEVNPRKYLP